MSPPRSMSLHELSQYNGTDPSKPIYLALRGAIYDVSSKPQLYGPGGECHMFAGKDVSKAYAMSGRGSKSGLKAADFNADYSNLTEEEVMRNIE
ncbi:UNVERIFIED_CONTAM: hypothetical protein HDU68_006066 [Siphonaria sp. JEL0065]|nr:hypothetical protein HDU68_006066 [Siphonaria sp. JEL0065]